MFRVIDPELRRLDELTVEAVCLPLFEEDRPFRGGLSLVDWRLAGLLSRWVLEGFLRGTEGERLLTSSRGKFAFPRIFVFGAGSRARFGETQLIALVDSILGVLEDAQVTDSAWDLSSLPQPVSAERAFEVIVPRVRRQRSLHELTLIANGDVAAALAGVVERERRRAHSEAPPG